MTFCDGFPRLDGPMETTSPEPRDRDAAPTPSTWATFSTTETSLCLKVIRRDTWWGLREGIREAQSGARRRDDGFQE